MNSYPGVNFEGRVIEINPAVDEQTRSAKVRIQVDNAGGKLKAGMFAQGEILTGVKRALVIPVERRLPRRPVGQSRPTSSCWKTARPRAATCASAGSATRKLEIVEGLKPGDQVIAEQSIEIAEGVRVEPRR